MNLGLLFLFGPLAAFLLGGYLSARQPTTNRMALFALAAASTVAWLVFIALVPHADGEPTVIGTTPMLDGDSTFFLWPALAVAPCAIAGWRRDAGALAIGAAAVVGPSLLANGTMPRGDGDGLWALVFLYLPFLGLGFSTIAAIATIIHHGRPD